MLKGQEKQWLTERVALIRQQAQEYKNPKKSEHQSVPTLPIVSTKPFNQGEIKLNELTAYLYLLESDSAEYYLRGNDIPGDLASVQSLEGLIQKMLETEDDLGFKLKQVTALVSLISTAVEEIYKNHRGGKLAKVVGVRATDGLSGVLGSHAGLTDCSRRTQHTLKTLEAIKELLEGVAPASPTPVNVRCA